MSIGLDLATGVAGLFSLSITLFNGCVQAFQLISEAQDLSRSSDRVRCMLEWEQYRLVQWGERVGLDNLDNDSTTDNRNLNWNLVKDILSQLQGLLTDAKVLHERYNLDVVSVGSDDTAVKDQPPLTSTRRRGIGRLWTYVKPDLQTTRVRILQEVNGPIRKLRWAALDSEKLRALVCDIAYFNNSLHDLLESAEQDFVRTALSALLRNLISRTTLGADLDIIKALLDTKYISGSSSIGAAASLKQTRLLLGIDKRRDEILTTYSPASKQDDGKNGNTMGSTKLILSKLKYQFLQRDAATSSIENRRELAIYKSSSSRKSINSQVLVEWKPVEKELEEKLKRRIEGLALLISNNSDPSFHSLKCLGFLKHDTPGPLSMYAFVYEVIDIAEEAPPYIQPSLRPLLTLFDCTRLPSLTHRIQIALALAETVLQLHTSGWLHKGIRSENILFLDRGPNTWENGTSLGPYVAGYEYARADNPLELTEETPSNPIVDLYRHPQAQGVARQSFKKAHDLFALGCVLLEVALWTNLQDILHQAVNTSEIPSKVDTTSNNRYDSDKFTINTNQSLLSKDENKGILDRVAFHAGDNYRATVEMCLLAGTATNSVDEDNDPEILVEIELAIVNLLKK